MLGRTRQRCRTQQRHVQAMRLHLAVVGGWQLEDVEDFLITDLIDGEDVLPARPELQRAPWTHAACGSFEELASDGSRGGRLRWCVLRGTRLQLAGRVP